MESFADLMRTSKPLYVEILRVLFRSNGYLKTALKEWFLGPGEAV